MQRHLPAQETFADDCMLLSLTFFFSSKFYLRLILELLTERKMFNHSVFLLPTWFDTPVLNAEKTSIRYGTFSVFRKNLILNSFSGNCFSRFIDLSSFCNLKNLPRLKENLLGGFWFCELIARCKKIKRIDDLAIEV